MKIFLFAFTLLLSAPLVLIAQNESVHEEGKTTQLDGIWTIDLRPTPDSEPYLKEFVIALKSDGSFSGEFYGSTFTNGLINKNWGKVYFAFSTNDQSSQYFHSGYLFENKIYGTTYCPNRDFIAPWNGTKNE